MEKKSKLNKNGNGRLTQKQETFCLNLSQGMSQRDAYTAAGYSLKQSLTTIDHNACVLANSSKILTRYEELRQFTEDASQATVLERRQRLTEIMRARLTDYITCGPDRDLIDVGPESPNTAAFQEITSRTEFDKDGAGVAVITKLKLHGPIQAIAELNKMEHIYDDRAPIGPIIVNSFTFLLPDGTKVSPKELKEYDNNNH